MLLIPEGLCQSPVIIGQEAGYILDRSYEMNNNKKAEKQTKTKATT